MSGMRSRSLGPRSWVRGGEWARPGRDRWAGAGRDFRECRAWPVVFIWLVEGTSQAHRLPVTAEQMSAARRLHRVILCHPDTPLTLSCGPRHAWTEAHRPPCGWALRTSTGRDKLLCQQVRTSAFELDPSAV